MSYKLGRNVSFLEIQHELDENTMLLVESAWTDTFGVSFVRDLQGATLDRGLAFHIIERESDPDMFDFILAWRWWDKLEKEERAAQRPRYE